MANKGSTKEFKFHVRVQVSVQGHPDMSLGEDCFKEIHRSFIEDVPMLRKRFDLDVLPFVHFHGTTLLSANGRCSLGMEFSVFSEEELTQFYKACQSGEVAASVTKHGENTAMNIVANLSHTESLIFTLTMDKRTYHRGMTELCEEQEDSDPLPGSLPGSYPYSSSERTKALKLSLNLE